MKQQYGSTADSYTFLSIHKAQYVSHHRGPVRCWNRCIGLVLFWTILFGLWSGSLAHAQAPSGTDSSPESDAAIVGRNAQTLLVGVSPDADRADLEALFAQSGMVIGRTWPELNLVELHLREDVVLASGATYADATQAIKTSLPNSSLIRYASYDAQITIASPTIDINAEPPELESTPNDTYYDSQWSLPKIGIPKAWNITYGSPTVTVAIMDTGYDLDHSEFAADAIWTNVVEENGRPNVDDDNNGLVDDIRGWDWVDDDNRPDDLHGHGSHVMGVIAATTNNANGIAGIGRQLRVAPLRVLDSRGVGYISDLVDALEYARQQGFRIVNLSLATNIDFDPLREAVQAAWDDGVIVVAATGNNGSYVSWPGAYPEALSVAAVDSQDIRASFSGAGSAVDVAGPGVDITSTYLDNAYASLKGTSMATPHVSAQAGLLWSLRPDLSAAEIIDLIKSTAVDVNAATKPGLDDDIGSGRIDIYGSLLEASRGLEMAVEGGVPSYVVVGQSVPLPVRVSVAESPSTAPIQGTLVSAALSAGDGAAEVVGSHGRTDASGVANLSITAPTQAGIYTLSLQTGQQVTFQPLIVTAPPAAVTLIFDQSEIRVGESTPFRIEIRNQDGELETASVPIRLTADLGEFSGGVVSADVQVVGGVYEALFYAGTRTGIATITVSVGPISANQTVRLLTGPLTSLIGPGELSAAVSLDEPTTIQLDFQLSDAFGNPAPDDTVIQIYANKGQLASASIVTRSGIANTSLTVPMGFSEPITVWALVPGTPLQTRVDISVSATRLWLPSIQTP